MAKKSGHTLLSPPRYHSGDLRNLVRIRAGVLFSMQLAGSDWPVRKLRRHKYTLEVTLPPQVRNTLELRPGDWLLLCGITQPNIALLAKVPDQQAEQVKSGARDVSWLVVRKATCHNNSLRVTIPQPICEMLSAGPGDSLVFGLTPRPGVVSICAVKGGGDSTGSRRSG
jgi:bifunctional DNA-binding transcriptional regulator/antitoxin component of YhaV-PrlF toxin-antitoxin module